MAGHSKWSQIKRQKAAADSKRGATFSKLAREIHVAVREGGPSPEANVRLRMAIERSKREGMPNDNIDRAIAKASGAGGETENYETVFYEGYGPGGVAVLAIGLTDNRNRTASEVRHAFTRHGGTLGQSGSVAWQFDTVGQIVVDANGTDPDEVALLAIDAGARDVETDTEEIVVTTEPDQLALVAEQLKDNGLAIREADIQRVAQTTVDVEGSQAQTTLKLLEALEDLDDVQAVYTTANFPEEMSGVA
jgi:YebC/PmpR family DNA-binding regulatory protein